MITLFKRIGDECMIARPDSAISALAINKFIAPLFERAYLLGP